MSLRFWLGPAGSGKSTKIYNYMINEAIKHPDMFYYIIVPEQANLQTQQELVRLHPRKGILNIDVLSFNRLAHRIFEETGYGRDGGRVIDDMGKNLVLRRVAQLNKEQLPMLGDNLTRLGYITQVKSVISEFMQYGINQETVEVLAEDASSSHKAQLSEKLKDISLLYKEFLSFIKDHYTTREELMIRLSRTLPESVKIKRTVLVFDGFTGFTPVQTEVLEQLLLLCPEVHVVLNLDKRAEKDDIKIEEHELFYMSKNTIRKLGEIADKCQVKQLDPVVINDEIPVRFVTDNTEGEKGKGLNEDELILPHLERNIFRKRPEKYDVSGLYSYENKTAAKELPEDFSEKKGIHILSALSPDDEMEYVSEKIAMLLREKNIKYNEIAIITGDIELYRSCIERSLMRHGIPFFTDKTQPVLLNPMIEYLRAAISVLSDNYTYESVFRLLKTGLTDIDRENIDEFENYVLAMGIRGRSGYQRPFARLPKAYRNYSADDKAEYLLRINSIRQDVDSVFSLLESDISDKFNAGTKATVKVFATSFYKLLVRGNISSRLEKRAESLYAEGRISQAKTYEQIYERTMKVFEQMVELLGEEKLTVREFGQLLDAGLDEIRIGIIPGTTDYIQVGDLTRSRVGRVKALLMVGVNDGLIPQGISSGGLISDDDRTFFTERHSELVFAPTARENAYTQRLYLYMMLTKPSEYLYLSYSKINQAGESIRPSYLIRNLQNLFPGLKTETDNVFLAGRLADEKGSFKIITENFEPYIENMLEENDAELYEELIRHYCFDEEYRRRIKLLIENRIPEESGLISGAVAGQLYGTNLNTSITRLETYASCAYEYYLKYGLCLNEREMFDFASSDLGNVFHSALEVYTNRIKERGLNWHDITDEEAAAIMEEAVEYAVASENLAALYSTRRQSYMVKRIKRIMHRTASVLKYQASKGSFEPHSVEVDFKSISDLESLNLQISPEESIRLFGRIDRIDTCTEGDVTYVRVIDYKSGSTSLDIEAVYEGRQLQLVVYMDTALELVGRKNGNRTVPAGILYYHIDDPMLKADEVGDISQIEGKIREKLKMAGYVNSDRHIIELMDAELDKKSDIIPVEFKKDGEASSRSKVLSTDEFAELGKAARKAMIEMGERLLSGDISTAKEMGYLSKYPQTCDYCPYKTVCHQKKGGEL